MTVESPLELYTLLYGWKQYDNLWNILAYTGLVYLPFAWLLLENVIRGAKEAESSAQAAVMSRRPLLADVGIALLVIAFAGAPLTTIQPGVLAYQNPCIAERNGPVRATGTTYDTAFDPLVEPVDVPAWWRLVMALSYGINRAAIEGLGCTEDITLVRQSMVESRINDPFLAGELKRFREECFYPARSSLQASLTTLSTTQRQALDALIEQYGQQDLAWEGSQVYQSPVADLPPLYAVLFANEMNPVPGFEIDPDRESDLRYIEALAVAQEALGSEPFQLELQWGIPSCLEWWRGTGAQNGLRTRLLQQLETDTVDRVLNLISSKPDSQIEDELLMELVSREPNIPNDASFAGSNYTVGVDNGVADSMKEFASNLGIAWEGLSTAPMLHAVKAALPMIKAFLMMGIILFIPLALVGSAYRLDVLFLITVGLVAVNFLAVVWAVAWALEQGLIRAFWPDQTDFIAQAKYTLSTLTDTHWALKVEVLKFLLPFLYLFLPMVFFTVVGWAGMRAFVAISAIMGQLLGPTQKAGRVGADMGKGRLRS
ncbi:MAG: conjugal transfer protein TraG N-terminal domain-containing protein [Candidatus Competibacteraceae bacterium]|nr:conjugal transfer protein TraG N-terminal domain-containing protein [Candidatus Competibacteraceae bacterium]